MEGTYRCITSDHNLAMGREGSFLSLNSTHAKDGQGETHCIKLLVLIVFRIYIWYDIMVL